ncbi:MAG: CHAT domain-containing protein, partial [Chloroflexi bacterium]|nr:CHAT domain-containing protein [Chloroflexota bacterium]
MTTLATVRLAEDGKWLHLRCPAAKLDEQRQFSRADYELLKAWAIKHRLLAHHQEPINGSAQRARQEQADALLKLGEELFAWLNGPEQFLSRLLNTVQPPLLSEFAVSRQDSAEARAFLDAPWELLAAQHEHWALSPNHAFCPLRRIGQSLDPPDPAPYRLSLVFLAASPRAETSLDYEGEEASFLLSTRGLGLDLVVEESGTLELLAACLARELPEVAHISCHGRQRPSPGLLLEDELGDGDWVNTAELVRRLADYRPRMLFLSACESAGADPVFASLAWSLVWAGLPAVLGWAAPVYDHEARIFAASLYRRLTAGDDLAHALAYARLDLAQAEELRDPAFAGHGSRDWHLARLYLGAQGGGRLAKAGGPLRRPERGQAVRTFLDAKGQVPVASELEFVGRRREMQAILRELRAPRSQRHAGVLIHGL